MMKKLLLVSSIFALSILIHACGGSSTKPSNTSKPANTNTSTTAKKEPPPPVAAVPSKPKPPEEKTKDVPNKLPVPKDWTYYSDEVKGYGFYLPEGSKGQADVINGINIFRAETPTNIGITVFAWKDKTATKESLLSEVESFMSDAWGETITAGKLTGESDDYAVCEATSVDQAGKKYKMKILVGTDVTDNYVMLVYTDDSKFEANRQIIEEIWGNFEMFSGGASGNK